MTKKLFPDGTEVVPFYVRAIRSGPFVFVSGQVAMGDNGELVPGGIDGFRSL